jgi:hypothetical protein
MAITTDYCDTKYPVQRGADYVTWARDGRHFAPRRFFAPFAQLKRALGDFRVVHLEYTCGTVQQTSTGELYDWWLGDQVGETQYRKVVIVPAT